MTNSGEPLRQRKPRGYEQDSDDIPEIISSDGSEADLMRLDSSSNQQHTAVKKQILYALLVVFGLVVLYLILATSPIEPVVISLSPPPKLEGNLQVNTRLTHASHKFAGELLGPESLAFDPTGKYLYTGTADGKIMEIYGGKVREVTRLGNPPCGSYRDEPTCGRPLGMKFNKDGFLIVADAYLGLFEVNVVTGDTSLLISSDELESTFLNDVDIAQRTSNLVYVTESSTKWGRRDNRHCILEGKPTGRLLEFNPDSREVKTLLSNLSFANGVVLSYKEDFILVAETGAARIQRLWLTGSKKGQTDIFSDNLPGLPDNIRRSGRGTYWVAMAALRHADKFSIYDFAASRPWLRKFLMKIISQETFMKLLPRYGLIVELDRMGKIVQSLHDPAAEVVSSVSQVEEHDRILYMGSYYHPHLSILNLRQESKHR